MKAIVVRQPYAALIVAGVKTLETRPAPPNGPMRPEGVRGLPGLAIEPGERIAICAAAAKPKEGERVGDWRSHQTLAGRWLAWRSAAAFPATIALHFGAVVGTVVVAKALPIGGAYAPITGRHIETDGERVQLVSPGWNGWLGRSDISDQLPLGEYAPGRWGWLLTYPQPCTPVPVTGRQGVFALPADVAEQVEP